MAWFNRVNKDSESTETEIVEIDIFDSPAASSEVRMNRVEAAKASSEMETVREERDKEEKSTSDQEVVVQGAKVKFNAHLGEFTVLSDVPTTQNKLTGTIVEKQLPNFTFYDGFILNSLATWQDFGSYKVQGNEVLIKKSKINGVGIMPGSSSPESGTIEFVDSGQINIPEQISTAGASVPQYEEPDFDIKLELIKGGFVPLGIADFKGNIENDKIKFKMTISGKGVNQWDFKIEHQGQLIYESFSGTIELDEVVINGKGRSTNQQAVEAPTYEEERFWPAGEYTIGWDGFDTNNIYDSTLLTSEKGFSAVVTAKANHKTQEDRIEDIKCVYKEVDWVDVKIDRANKRIDTTLRVDLRDGGSRGLECITYKSDFGPNLSQVVCPWEKITPSVITSNHPIIKSRTRSFDDLEKLAIEGLNYHWGRNRNHAEAKDVKIDTESYEVYIDTVNTRLKAMDDVDLIYNTNNEWLRSGNPGSATWNPITWIGNAVSREAVSYNVGYIYSNDKWNFTVDADEDTEFKFTSAHEIGHEILKIFGSTKYSYGHKGTVHVALQMMKASAPAFAQNGEIDIMPYYLRDPSKALYNRYAAAQEDVLGLIWNTKIKIK